MDEIQKWNHSRKGLIVGRVVEENDGWLTVELTEDLGGPYPQAAGARVTVAKRFIEEVAA